MVLFGSIYGRLPTTQNFIQRYEKKLKICYFLNKESRFTIFIENEKNMTICIWHDYCLFLQRSTALLYSFLGGIRN